MEPWSDETELVCHPGQHCETLLTLLQSRLSAMQSSALERKCLRCSPPRWKQTACVAEQCFRADCLQCRAVPSSASVCDADHFAGSRLPAMQSSASEQTVCVAEQCPRCRVLRSRDSVLRSRDSGRNACEAERATCGRGPARKKVAGEAQQRTCGLKAQQ